MPTAHTGSRGQCVSRQSVRGTVLPVLCHGPREGSSSMWLQRPGCGPDVVAAGMFLEAHGLLWSLPKHSTRCCSCTLVPTTWLHTYTLWPGHLQMSFTLWQVKSFPPCWCCAAKLEGAGQSDGASWVACGIVSAPMGGITCAGSAPEFPWLCPRQTDEGQHCDCALSVHSSCVCPSRNSRLGARHASPVLAWCCPTPSDARLSTFDGTLEIFIARRSPNSMSQLWVVVFPSMQFGQMSRGVSLTLDLLISDYQVLLAVARAARLYEWCHCPAVPVCAARACRSSPHAEAPRSFPGPAEGPHGEEEQRRCRQS